MDFRLKSVIENFSFLPIGEEIWIYNEKDQQWIIIIKSDGHMKYNLPFFNEVFAVFSLNWKQYQNFLKSWTEKLFEVPIRSAQKVNADLGYMIDNKKKQSFQWQIQKRYNFSYQVVESYLKKKEKTNNLKIQQFFGDS